MGLSKNRRSTRMGLGRLDKGTNLMRYDLLSSRARRDEAYRPCCMRSLGLLRLRARQESLR